MKKFTSFILATFVLTTLVIQPAQVNVAQADVSVSVHWINDYDFNCHKQGESPAFSGIATWTAEIENFGNEGVYIEKAAFHDPVSGCAGTTHTLNQSVFNMSGKTNYAPGESGQTVFTFDTKSFNCGRVQLDAAYRNVNGSYEGSVFMGEVIDYGVDCDSTPQPASCFENAALSANQIIPAQISAGSAIPFELSIYNSGETWFYNGSYFQLSQTSNLSISPPYGHLSPSMKPGDSQPKSFTLTAPSTPGNYTISFQMVHRAGAEYKDANGHVCAPAPSSDVYFGNQLSMTFEVVAQTQSTGKILVTSNIPTSWTVNGPQNFSGNGTYAMYTANTGSYQLISVPVNMSYQSDNYKLTNIYPNSAQLLSTGSTISFQITYEKTYGSEAPVINATNNSTCKQLVISWSDNSNRESGYHVYRAEQDHGNDLSKYQRIATLGANSTSYTDHPQSNKSYYYVVSAYVNSTAENIVSAPFKSSVVTACTALIDGSMSVVAVNGQTNFKLENIKHNDTLTIQLLVDNLGPSAAYITKITDNPSANLVNVRNLSVTGQNAVINSPAISGSHPNYTFNLSGKKDVGGNKWVVKFDATLDTGKAVAETISNCATINYYDETGSKIRKVCLNQILSAGQKGEVKFREVAP